ncbi:Mediator of DNA damage checkpoint protein 1 [Cyphomyrmex costatus]|uniref:Mediator of DNA damage checkpoint protein 1 n=1 Tax=Cyphomyrmex costatus TaxID=456900 RepID=A0A195C0D0_9HYME|nr:Mediator of DNA damage checkpoint protein 1 [Cyphomyrmex costatus]
MLSINSTDYPIKIGITKIGRLDTCNIVIQNETVSKLHAEIEASGRGSTWICDLKSLNKTKLNNLVLKSNRSYELKDRSVIEFGGVCATYHTYCPANDLVIPETPAPSRQKTTNIIIPNTPDSSLNNSSGMDNDGSIILGTQKDDENSIFRRPRVLRQNLSPSINKKNTSKNESNDSLSAITLHTSNINVSENQVNIDDTETQKFDEECKPTSNSIYDMETQGDIFKPIETNTKITKQLPKLNVCDKTAGRSVTDIHDMETQNYINDINGMEIQENNVIAEKFTTDIHTMKTQIYADNIDEDDKDAQKSEIDNNQEKSLAKIECNIHDLETQKYDENYIAKDISDLETQLELHSVATGEQNKDISNMETQFEVDNRNNKRSIQSSKLMKRDDELAETRKQILKSDPIELKVDDTKENTSICIPCPSGNGQRAQILDTLYESDDDILMRLPAVRISGTLSNPASPSASSSSTVRSTKSKRNTARDRLYNNEYSCPKRQKKRSKESSRVSPDVSEDPKQSMDVKLKNSATTSSRITRHSSKKNDEGPHNQKETLKNIVSGATESTQSETKSIIGKRKVSLNVIEKSVEQTTSKKRKTVTEECPVSTRSRRNAMKIATNRQSPNILEHFTKTRLRENISKNMKSFEDNKAISKTTLEETQEIFLTDGNVYPEKVNVKRTRQTRQIIYDNQVMTHGNDVTPSENSKKNKPSPTKGVEAQTNKPQKILKVILSPLKSFSDDASQEVESIMTRGSSNIQDKNLSIREGSKAKIFKRKLRTRSKKQQNSDTETDSVLTESKMFKKPRITRNSTSSLLDISAENTTDENSQGSIESNASISSRSSRSRTTRKKMESNQNTHKLIDKTASTLHTNTETTSLILTPSRTRRSTSSLNNSISSAMKHNVLFTGIMEDYSEIVNTLGGSKVEDPAECTILVTDKVRRTYKFLCALAKGIPIVTIDWLRESETAKRFLNWENYILKDPAAETKFGFRLRKSLNRAKEKKMLDGYIVVLTPNVEPPPIKELKVIVSSCGGKALLRPPTKWPEKAVVLSREEDLRNAKKFLVKAPKTVTVQSTEFILTGILRQEIDFVKYKLTG